MASIGFLFSGVSTCSALCASLVASGLPLPSGGSCSSGSARRPGGTLFGGDQPEQNRLGRSGFFRIERWQAINAARHAQGLAQGFFLDRLVGQHLGRRNPVGEVGVDQALIARLQAGVAPQRFCGGQLIADEPGPIVGDIAGGNGGQPQVEITIQGFFREGGNFRWQAQGFGIAASLRNLFAAAGQALQPTPPGAMLFGRGGCHLQSGVAAKGTKQDTGCLFDLGQLDGGLWVVTARSLGNPVVPDFADEFFHDSDFPTGVFVGV